MLTVALAGVVALAADEPTSVVGNYESALDHITQELIDKLEKAPVLVIWCFDESESMKDDHHEIRERIALIYEELKLVEGVADDAVLSAVTSYGARFHLQTSKPTADVRKLRAAINAIPIDKTGKELMCSAVGQSVAMGRKWVPGDKRQMMIIVVTDESGDPADNQAMLERAISEAKASNCPVYFLARQATFGTPFGHLRWRHPQTNRVHWLRTDQGPETAFAQTLQTDGFGRRRDAFASGFGSYEQMRLVRETAGIFFMLPSIELGLARAGDQPDNREVLRHYRPDWRPRAEIIADRDRSPLRTQLWKVIQELNPYDPVATKIVSLKTNFSVPAQKLRMQLKTEGVRSEAYLARLAAAEKSLEVVRELRDAEKSPRWRANYDLMRAQLVAYQARARAYRDCLDQFFENPPAAPATKKPNLRLASWQVAIVRANNLPESAKLAERATPLLRAVIENHPDTPWARRADWELKRGFGVTLIPRYDQPVIDAPRLIRPPVL